MEPQNSPKMQDLNTESQSSQSEWTLHNVGSKILLSYRSDTIKKNFLDIVGKKTFGKTIKFSVEKRVSLINWLILSPRFCLM